MLFLLLFVFETLKVKFCIMSVDLMTTVFRPSLFADQIKLN